MVLAFERTRPGLHPDPRRIAGYAVAIAFNTMLLLLILVPMQGPQGLRIADTPQPSILWYPLERPKPQIVEVVPPSPRPQPPQATHARIETPQPPVAVPADAGEQVVPAIELPAETGITDTPVIAEVPRGPLPGVRLEYLRAPPPVYPRDARRAHVEGSVLLQVLVDIDGRPLQVDIRQGSGNRRLDAAAREQVMAHWRFRPAMQDGRAVQAIGLVPIQFKLD